MRAATDLYGPAGHLYDHLSGDLAYACWLLEYKSRRYHELYRTKRGKHGHKGDWDSCETETCRGDRRYLDRHLRSEDAA